jgi:hypothetical protein
MPHYRDTIRNCEAKVTVEVDDQPVISATAATLQNDISAQVGKGQLPPKKLSDTIRLAVKIHLPGKLCGEIGNLRTEPRRVKVQDLDTDSIALSNDKDGVSATFKLSDLPAAVDLPEWGKSGRGQ